MSKDKIIKPLNEMEKYRKNPFCESLMTTLTESGKERVRKMVGVSSGDTVIDSSTGEIKDSEKLFMVSTKWIDEDEFIKIYLKEMKVFFDMTKAQQSLLKYIMSKLEWNKDFFYFDFDEFTEEHVLSKSSLYRALAFFCDIELIARSSTYNKYFINPVMMFKGDRIVIGREYVKGKYPLIEASDKEKSKRSVNAKSKKFISLMSKDHGQTSSSAQ